MNLSEQSVDKELLSGELCSKDNIIYSYFIIIKFDVYFIIVYFI